MAMKRLSLSLGLVLCLALTRFAVNEAIHEDALITHLPGFSGKFPSRHYSGYVEAVKDMRLFYYFIVSERQPETDPVVLWLNGGPGCSSFDGFIYEHDKFIGSLPRLHLNPYSWSKVSNIIYLDSPVGVGLSYSKHKTKYKNDDIINALDTHMFLIKWFELYPEFVENPFYISGESYAGVYIPTLASEIAEGIENGFEPKINFKGYMIGNGVVADPVFDTDVLISYIHSMGLISDNLFEDIQSTCKGKRVDQRKCLENLKKAVNLVADLNKYHILEPCYHPPKTNHENIKRINTTLMRKWMFGHGGVVSRWIDSEGRGDCINDELATAWLNNEEVRKAIHTEPGAGHRVPESKPKEALHFYRHWLEGKPI
ncbi:serine carboxypeptidase-like 20 [Tripterygium wilfordii]|uniref:Carboxypeptidase n=1 Tax=Tripterygium wilfordii TaxID=458696 RepID=A0A7J7DDH1_TRIWF|nr:serine carboxypeptidase-like 20 [Tripterygium wilfordii]